MQKKDTKEVRPQEPVAEDTVPEEKEPFVPSATSKRVFAWILFAIVFLGLVSWLLSIAFPHWIDDVRAGALGLLH